MLWTALVLSLLLSPSGMAAAADPASNGPEIVEIYPNPVPPNDVGEYVLVTVAEPTSSRGWTLVDDAGQRATPAVRTVNGTVALSRYPSAAAELTDHPVVPLHGSIQLANRGQELVLRVNGTAVDRVRFPGPAPEAERWVLASGTGRWLPLGATDLDPVSGTGPAEAFVLPDAPRVVVDLLDGASERIHLGAYTLADPAVVDALIEAHRRGVSVDVHAEGRPVGGISRAMYVALDRLVDAGIDVTVHRGPYARWGYHHAKYAVVDDRLLLATENWKPSGLGGRSNRGWGVAIANASLADAAAAVFRADTGWRDAQAWSTARERVSPIEAGVADDTLPRRHDPVRIEAVPATLLVAPDHAESILRREIAAAESHLDIIQVSVGGPGFPLLHEAIAAAERGVAVRLLLSGAWEVREESRALASALRERARSGGLDLEVRLLPPNPRFNRIHAKGVVIDTSRVVLGSINWNNHSLRENRELALLIEDPRVAEYYARVFEADWPEPGGLRIHLGLIAATLALGGTVAVHVRRFMGGEPSD